MATMTNDVERHVTINDDQSVTISSRGKKPWLARLGARHPKYGRERDFLALSKSTGGMRGQIVRYESEPLEPGEYEVCGDEFGEFRGRFTIE